MFPPFWHWTLTLTCGGFPHLLILFFTLVSSTAPLPLSSFLFIVPSLSSSVCACVCVSACVCGGSLPCLGAGVRSRERGLDRRSTLWQNRNRISWGELTQQASLLPLPPSLSVYFSLSLLSPSVRTKLPDSDSCTRCERKDSGAASRRESILASKSHFTHFSRLFLSFSLCFSLIFTEQWNKKPNICGRKTFKA